MIHTTIHDGEERLIPIYLIEFRVDHPLERYTYSHKYFTVVGSNHNKTEKWFEKIIS